MIRTSKPFIQSITFLTCIFLYVTSLPAQTGVSQVAFSMLHLDEQIREEGSCQVPNPSDLWAIYESGNEQLFKETFKELKSSADYQEDLYTIKGILLYENKNYIRSKIYFNKALKINPNSMLAKVGIGLNRSHWNNQGILNKVRRTLDELSFDIKGKEVSHKEWVGHLLKGRLYLRLNRYDQAFNTFQQCLEFSNNSAQEKISKAFLGMTKSYQSHYDEAITWLESIELDKLSYFHSSLASDCWYLPVYALASSLFMVNRISDSDSILNKYDLPCRSINITILRGFVSDDLDEKIKYLKKSRHINYINAITPPERLIPQCDIYLKLAEALLEKNNGEMSAKIEKLIKRGQKKGECIFSYSVSKKP